METRPAIPATPDATTIPVTAIAPTVKPASDFVGNVVEVMGPRIRRQRTRMAMTLDDLAAKTGISKPYLSLIETCRVPNPPRDEKLQRIEQALGFPVGELVNQAHLHRTPKDVRAVLQKLMKTEKGKARGPAAPSSPQSSVLSPQSSPPSPINLDAAFRSGVLQKLVEQAAGNVERVVVNVVPVINKVSAGYPRDFTDLSYPKGVADDYIGCPDLRDGDAFAARVHGDSMSPKYRSGDIVIFSPAATPQSGEDCFVRFEDGQTTFKRAFFETSAEGGHVIRLQPRNEKYPPRTVPAEQVSGLYKAVYKYQRVDEE